ncbi:MAG: CDP-alcohol phosphatidyltransferase, partial [Candidatus Hydrogenedentes bacterium]|nr:CDP-alcohol phosphatidyltransferase [Candidatus Hydrogenedentota bacterium]
DATDGILARLVGVSGILPGFSGAQVDNAVDVLTFIWVPIFIMGREELLPHPFWLVVPILAALYAYGQVNMKTPDNFFLGFPSYWNIVALYMWWLQPPPLGAILMVAIPGVLSFIPTRYLYPSRNFMLWQTSWGLGLVWVGLLIYLILQEDPSRTLIWISLFYPIYYVALSFYIDFGIRRRGRTV